MTRLGAVKQFFHAFANRSMAYRYPHVIGLTLFGNAAKRSCELTELFVNFQAHIDRAEPDGSTALYDALDMATTELNALRGRYPDCSKRILCLTDGDDTSSSKAPEAVTRRLQQTGVVVDAVMVGPGNSTLKAIATATGGCSFVPKSLHEAQVLFEMETVLSLRERDGVAAKDLVSTEAELRVYEDLELYPYVCMLAALPLPSQPHVAPRQHHHENRYSTKPVRKPPAELQQGVASAAAVVAASAAAPPIPEGGASNPNQIRRILRELRRYIRSPHPKMEVYPVESNIAFWRILLSGPEDTPYEGGTFLLYVKFPEEYPTLAPEVRRLCGVAVVVPPWFSRGSYWVRAGWLFSPQIRFVTPIYHCNINSTGKVCHSVFGRNYAADTTLKVIVGVPSCVCRNSLGLSIGLPPLGDFELCVRLAVCA